MTIMWLLIIYVILVPKSMMLHQSRALYARYFSKIRDLVFDSVQPSGDDLYLVQEDAVSWWRSHLGGPGSYSEEGGTLLKLMR